jgi:amidohydrolase
VDREVLKARACAAIDAAGEEIVALGERIFRQPELGFKEERTAALVADAFARLGLPYRSGLAITGLRADLAGGAAGPGAPRLAVLGELDSLVCPEHPCADPATGAAHSCGHHAQIAAMVGVAAALVRSGAAPALGGHVAFLAVPAEEYVEIEYREGLRRQGRIRFLGGKQEFIRLGILDDVHLAMMIHLAERAPGAKVALGGSCNGFIGKLARFRGREAHAAGAPERGVNALAAAHVALAALNAQRDTFRDEDHVRVHPILTKGGDLVNIVPADVRLETYVRARSVPAILDANEKVNRALRAGAMALAAEVEITELPGYLPQIQDPALGEVFRANAAALVGEGEIVRQGHAGHSSDMGDLTHIMPAIQPGIGAVEGAFHSKDFHVVDPELAYLGSAKMMAMTTIDLLADGAEGARRVVAGFKAPFTRSGYLAFWDGLLRQGG